MTVVTVVTLVLVVMKKENNRQLYRTKLQLYKTKCSLQDQTTAPKGKSVIENYLFNRPSVAGDVLLSPL